jgi:hypothetical protein
MRNATRRFRPALESLEGRLTPTNVSATIIGTTLVLAKTAPGNDSLTITRAATFGELTVTTTAGNTINHTLTTFTTPSAITAVTVNLGSGDDTLTLDGTATNGAINLPGSLVILGSGGNKTLSATSVNLLRGGSLAVLLSGNGTETSTFTDVNVSGAATVTHTGVGDTTFTITTSGTPRPDAVVNWGNLTIVNGSGKDTNTISDVNFRGSVSVNNGAGGSLTNISATNDQNLTSIGGSVTILNATGQTDNELYDYNVAGNVVISTGAGVSGQTTPNFVGVENIKSFPNSAIPVIGGSVTVVGTTLAGASPQLVIDFGTGTTPANLPLVISGNLTILAGGAGSVDINLNDLTVIGTTTVELGAQTHGDTFQVQGSSVTSVFNNFILISAATGNDTFSIQDSAGSIEFAGLVSVSLGAGNDTLNLAADSTHTTGVTGAVVDLFGASVFNGGTGTNHKFEGTHNTNVFFAITPVFTHFS